MLQSFCEPNTRVLYHGLPATVDPLFDSHIAIKFDKEEIGIKTLTLEEANSEFGKTMYFAGKGKIEEVPVNLGIDDKIELERRRRYIEELKRVSKKGGCGGVKLRQQVINRVQRQTRDKIGASVAGLQRWFKADKEHSQGLASTLRRNERKDRASIFTQEVKDMAVWAIDQYYLVPGNPTIQFVYDCFVDDVNEFLGEDVARPCYATFNEWVTRMTNPYDKMVVQYGKKAVRSANRKSLRKLVVERIHERVEVDAVHLAVGLVDNADRYLGTVTVFACIDCYSRSLLGIYVQIGRGESAASVIDSYKHAITPKTRDSYSSECVNDWPMFGVSDLYVGDGGVGNTAIKTISFCEDVGTQTETVDTGKGWKKPYVESFFATLRCQFARHLPGYCGKYTEQQLTDETVAERACLTYAQFHDALTHWIVDEYHQSPHKGLLGKTPYETWQEQAVPSKFPPMLPVNFERIKYIKGIVDTRTIQGEYGEQGIQYENVFYNDAEGDLKEIYRKLKARGEDAVVACEYSPNDISEINVTDPFTGEMLVIPTLDIRVTSGMTLSEFQAAYPTPKKNKGYGHPRVARKSKIHEQARQKEAEKRRQRKPKKSETAHIDEITDEVHELEKRNEEFNAQNGSRGADQSEKEIPNVDESSQPTDSNDDENKGFYYE
ncbi:MULTISPECIES: hypothetical protein [unclassified Neptuniibacter]|uniref:hypothetical protein n=1 Tax=unclassified Neptuniibacter TaxID=2630693 RepID=UPI000C46A6ED|nr:MULTISPECIES: hypothetical protein [unclassified Neptuniibacter]MAY43502.1 hypothetical protein [Oceanospirillaceae bacterium]|tara:strand:+ start:23186 stop:25171 length:1986 start_codon:yes stop_codon:yes gene_type:complete